MAEVASGEEAYVAVSSSHKILVVGSPPECHCWCNNGYFLRHKGVGLGLFGVVSAVTLALTL